MILGEGASALVVMELVKLWSGGLGDTPRQREEGPDMWATYVAALGSRSLLIDGSGGAGWEAEVGELGGRQWRSRVCV